MADLHDDIKITFKGSDSKISRSNIGDEDGFGWTLLFVMSDYFGGEHMVPAAIASLIESFLSLTEYHDFQECQEHLESFLSAYEERELRFKSEMMK